MASTAFLVRFSITHSNSDWQSITPQFSSFFRCRVSCTRLGMRLLIYSSEVSTASLINSNSLSGIEPIFEKRSAIFDRRFTSLSMSATIFLSTPIDSSSCVHAISDEIGVPSWCAVSFDRPTHTLFCSAFFTLIRAK